MSRAPAPSSPVDVQVIAALVGLWLCWGSSFPALRVLVATLPPLLACGAIFLVAGAVLAATRPSVLRGLTRRRFATTAGIGVGLLGAQGAVALAERHVFASTAALLVAAIPLWVVLLRLLVGERPGRAALVRVMVGLVGVAVVLVGSSSGAMGWSAWTSVVVAAAISWAGATLWASRSPAVPDPRAATVLQLLVGGTVLLLTGIAVGEPGEVQLGSVSAASWAAMAYLVVVDSLAGFALYNWLLRNAPVALVSTYAYAVPVVAYLLGVTVLGEPFHPIVLVGAAAIVAAVAAEVRAGR